MGRHDKFSARKTPAYQRELKELPLKSGERPTLIVLSYRQLDKNQGQSFEEWDEAGLLLKATEKLQAICALTVEQALKDKIVKQYSKVAFPPASGFTHPLHVPADVVWCVLHIQGKECIIGYFEDNIFHIVFLDKEHQFWPSKKRNT